MKNIICAFVVGTLVAVVTVYGLHLAINATLTALGV